jgi:hypothetical protein
MEHLHAHVMSEVVDDKDEVLAAARGGWSDRTTQVRVDNLQGVPRPVRANLVNER